MSEVVARLTAGAASAFAGEPVAFAYLFGSQATGRARARSDVDVAVMLTGVVSPTEFLQRSLRLAGELEAVAGVGPVEALVVLNEAPLPLAGRIRRERIVLYSADEPARVRYESQIARLFHDFQVHADPRDRARLRAIAAEDW
ncbi:nucleotidyltransferase domain-containing protein [Egibacter rhizosphaerae]|uniref:Nucleotidyltransferase domain-containing protein n=1 Tax=Egibacter rhizosphaerae TaxID=1670831 RepID=A0A411YHW3_9ACTN|nr:nucleotidyltransferase domain-containing protein [Egibacter rhizosphaerae]QBI20858.1 nucleotidyltransferase domain-containing protein [Egibacter rhizosphaerae]